MALKREPELAWTTRDAGVALTRKQKRVIVRALAIYIRDQHQRVAEVEGEHADIRRRYLRASQELLAFLLSAGVYLAPEDRELLQIDSEVRH